MKDWLYQHRWNRVARPEWRALLALCVIFAAALVVRVIALGEPMRYDESVTYVQFVRPAWQTTVSSYPYPNNHVFFSLLAKLTSAGAPFRPWAIRLPALLAGLATIPLTYAVGRALSTRLVGLLAAALVAASTPLVLFSANARGYSLVTALFLALLLLALRLRAKHSSVGWVLFSLLAAIGFYTIPIMLYPYGVIGTWLVLDAYRHRRSSSTRVLGWFALASIAAGGLAAIAYLPIIRTAGVGALLGNKFVTPEPWSRFAAQLPRSALGVLLSWTDPLPFLLAPLLLGLAIVGVVRHRRAHRGTPSLTLATVLWCAALLLGMHRVPFVRVWVFLLPLFLIAVALGIVGERQRDDVGAPRAAAWLLCAPVLAIGLAMLSVVNHSISAADDTGTMRSAPSVAEDLKLRLQSGDRVLAPIPSNGPLLFYFLKQQVDTSHLSVPMRGVRRAYVVLIPSLGQTFDRATAAGIVDGKVFSRQHLVRRFEDAELWVAERP
jgi:hypothetical protein